jgi:hypothetical protein
MFHVSASDNRDAILACGLDWRSGERQWGCSGEAVYLFDTVENARKWSTHYDDDYDIWQVDVRGLSLSVDTKMVSDWGAEDDEPDLAAQAAYDAYWARPDGSGSGAFQTSEPVPACALHLAEWGGHALHRREREITLRTACRAETQALAAHASA